MAKDLLWDANINRSPTSYLLNPQSERDQYALEGDTDKTMLQLKFASKKGEPKGILNWFAVHGTSMNATNLVRNKHGDANRFVARNAKVD
jgi:neutral ceramidase